MTSYFSSIGQAEDKTYSKRGAFLPEIEFDPIEYGIPPNIVPATDATQLLALVAAKQLILDLKKTNQERDLTNASVICGATSTQVTPSWVTDCLVVSPMLRLLNLISIWGRDLKH